MSVWKLRSLASVSALAIAAEICEMYVLKHEDAFSTHTSIHTNNHTLTSICTGN